MTADTAEKKKNIAGRNTSSPNKSLIVIVSWKMRDAIYVSKIFPDRADNSFLPIFSCIRNTWLSRLKQNNLKNYSKLEQMKLILNYQQQSLAFFETTHSSGLVKYY